MLEPEANHRINFFEQLHQQFLYLKGYGTYTYIGANEVDQLYDSYRAHQHASGLSQHAEINFIRSFIKSL